MTCGCRPFVSRLFDIRPPLPVEYRACSEIHEHRHPERRPDIPLVTRGSEFVDDPPLHAHSLRAEHLKSAGERRASRPARRQANQGRRRSAAVAPASAALLPHAEPAGAAAKSSWSLMGIQYPNAAAPSSVFEAATMSTLHSACPGRDTPLRTSRRSWSTPRGEDRCVRGDANDAAFALAQPWASRFHRDPCVHPCTGCASHLRHEGQR